MGTPRKMLTFKGGSPLKGGPKPAPPRNLGPAELGGVIFGCTDKTISECLTKQIFGLPGQHFVYVKHISTGLPLFLFNYSQRQLHGIFEAASPGQMSINPYGWTEDGSERTSYPAQVQICVQKNCRPLLETQFAPIIKGNYYSRSHFLFELDNVQVSRLIALFSTQMVVPTTTMPETCGKWKIDKKHVSESSINEERNNRVSEGYVGPTLFNESDCRLTITNPSSLDEIHQQIETDLKASGKNEIDLICEKLHKMTEKFEILGSNSTSLEEEFEDADNNQDENGGSQGNVGQEESKKESLLLPSDLLSIIAELRELKAFKEEAINKESWMQDTQQMLLSEIQQLKDRCTRLEACGFGVTEFSSDQNLDPDGVIFLAGGYDGKSWLTSLNSYSPQKDVIKSLRSMSSVRSYVSLAKLNGDIYAIGGGIDDIWYNTVESYNPVKNDWTSLPGLKVGRGGLAAATLYGKIFAIGGGNGIHCFSDVEMFDLDVGRWIPARSMMQKRFDLAAVELNGAIYAVGGFDGEEYLSSSERFDPREHSWSRLNGMKSKRACHSLVMLNEKLYAIGGYDGTTMVASVEVFDPRLGTWMNEAPMNYSRGYSATVALNDSIYAIGGLGGNDYLLDKIEQYQEGLGWQVTNLQAVGQRCSASAIVI